MVTASDVLCAPLDDARQRAKPVMVRDSCERSQPSLGNAMPKQGAHRSTPLRWRADLQFLQAASPFARMLVGGLVVVLAQACGEAPPVDTVQPDGVLAADVDVAIAGSDADADPDAATDALAPDVADAVEVDAADPIDAASDAVADAPDAATDAQSLEVVDAAVDASPADALADDATADAADAGDAAVDADGVGPQCTLNSDCAAVAPVAPCTPVAPV